MTVEVVILAAGKGTRMKSTMPKVLHKIAEKSMVEHVIDTANQLEPSAVHLIYGFGGDQLQTALSQRDLSWVEQKEQLGTGHAVQQVQDKLADDNQVLILYGDVPLTRFETLKSFVDNTPADGLGILTVDLDNPTGYGRIVRHDGHIIGIVEQKDASAEQLSIKEINTGIMVAPAAKLKQWLSDLSNDNAQGEYYLTDIVAMAHAEGVTIVNSQPGEVYEVEGVNNKKQLAALERIYQKQLADTLMDQGATLKDPSRLDIRGSVTVGSDVTIDVNVVFEGDVTLADGVSIGANCLLKDCVIGENTQVLPFTIVEQATVGQNVNLGPYARLRPNADIRDGAKVGNFVEIKKSVLGEGSKANHFTYLGDAEVGKDVNIGAGTITCNYDGVNKFKTIIEDGAFIGSNSSLVAPVRIGKNATVGAGSAIAKDAGDEELAVARGKQRNISGWERPKKT